MLQIVDFEADDLCGRFLSAVIAGRGQGETLVAVLEMKRRNIIMEDSR